ncbi:hypothetical protein TREES_T100017950 [Tupaia chinensis]|uniref:Uncharacterized protein n=1 Tax=Tupaia chinensis TaxID=246437 RepID=L9JR71_TUPCH|nr:hypothetical protein TREES_T100017950 [Tupaia chinensis]
MTATDILARKQVGSRDFRERLRTPGCCRCCDVKGREQELLTHEGAWAHSPCSGFAITISREQSDPNAVHQARLFRRRGQEEITQRGLPLRSQRRGEAAADTLHTPGAAMREERKSSGFPLPLHFLWPALFKDPANSAIGVQYHQRPSGSALLPRRERDAQREVTRFAQGQAGSGLRQVGATWK